MTFPSTPLPQKIEILRTTGWTDVTDYALRDPELVTISRGRSAEATSSEPTSISLTFNNNDNRFSPKAPEGAYYGTFGRNTPIRVSLPAAETYCRMPGTENAYVGCPDASALDITGDIDIRVDYSLLSWRAAQDLIGKYTSTSNQRSYLLQLNSRGAICLTWSTDGTTTGLRTAVSTVPVPIPAGHRLALRATLDVNNGASGRTATFYTSDTIDGTWTQLGDTVITSGTTSIYSSTATLRVGNTPSITAPLESGDPYNDFTDTLYETSDPPTGICYAAQVRSGIGGSVVANPDFRIQDAGDLSFADTASSPNTWTVTGDCEIDDRDYRGIAEVPSWPPRRTDISANQLVTPVQAAGIQQRLIKTGQPLYSAIRRALLTETSTVHYWPAEDAEGAESIAPGFPGGVPMTFTGTPSFQSSSTFAASDDLPSMENSTWIVNVPWYDGSLGETQVRFLVNIPSSTLADGTLLGALYADAYPIERISLVYNTASGGTLKFIAYSDNGIPLSTSSTVSPSGGMNGKNCYVGISLSVSGTTLTIGITVCQIGTGVANSASASPAGTAISSPTFKRILFGIDSDLSWTVLGHVSVHSGIGSALTILSEEGSYSDAWRGEKAGRRFERLCEEEGVAFQRWGNLDATPAMGNQHSDDLDHLLEECQVTDGGIRYEPREVFALGYRTASSLFSQPAGLTLDYASNELFDDPAPENDDRYTANDVTATRSTGSSYRVKQESGPLNVNSPADDAQGVGTYPQEITVYPERDLQVPDSAGWALHLGTDDDFRFPNVVVDLSNARIAADADIPVDAQRLDVGEVLQVDNCPADWGGGDKQQLVNRVTEVLGNFEHAFTYDCVSADPYRIAAREDAMYGRRDTAGSELAAAVDSDDTAMDVLTIAGPRWITTALVPGDFPFSAMVGGEEVSVTACTDGMSDDFSANQTDTWGSADVGGAWTSVGGAAADFDVLSGYGRHIQTAVDTNLFSLLTAVSADFDLYVDMATGALSTGASQYSSLVARYADTSNYYMVRVEFTTGAAVILTMFKIVAGSSTQLGSTFTSTLTHVAATSVRVRFQGFGSTLLAKVWAASGTEPSSWQVTATDSALTSAGSFGMRTRRATTNTNANADFRFDNFSLINPQKWTVTRSVNGVQKSHAAGDAVSLYKPDYRGK